jgi:hypothetical protein
VSFLGSVFGGQNPTLNSQIPMLTAMSGSLSKTGTTNLNDASSYFHKILGGDYSSLSPQIQSIRNQGNQSFAQMFNFGNRSGGTNSAAQTVGDRTATGVNNLISAATSGAASNIGSLGSTMLNAGLQSSNMAVSDSQMQMQNYINSILGQGMSMGAGFLEGKGLAAV